jgi:hypothetical protein
VDQHGTEVQTHGRAGGVRDAHRPALGPPQWLFKSIPTAAGQFPGPEADLTAVILTFPNRSG